MVSRFVPTLIKILKTNTKQANSPNLLNPHGLFLLREQGNYPEIELKELKLAVKQILKHG